MDSLLQKNFSPKKNNNKRLIGRLLLKEEYGKSKSILKDRKIDLLMLMETVERRFRFLEIMKKYHSLINKNKKPRENFIKFQENQYQKDLINDESISQNFLLTKLNTKSKSKENLKTLSSYISKTTKNFRKKNVKYCYNSSNDNIKYKRNFSFLTHDYFKNTNNKNRNSSNNFDYKKQIDFNKIRSKSSLSYYTTNMVFPSKIKNNNSDNSNADIFKNYDNDVKYEKIFKKLTKKYKFYPASYLEEHKNLEPSKYKFIFGNFNNKFSLLGKYDRLTVGVNDIPIYDKNIKYHIIKPSTRLIRDISRKRKKNNSYN